MPASSANLGPGFDALGLALAFHDIVTAEVTGDPGGSVEITVEGEGAGSVPLDARHLVHRALVRGFAELGVAVPAVRLHCANAIPHGRGLGSSSAAIVAGLALARELVEDGVDRFDDDRLFGVAAEIEGHPDNVAATVYGGLTIAYSCPSGFRAARLDVTAGVRPVVLVPGKPVETEVARGLLPTQVPHEDAACTAGRAALLVAALTGQATDLMAATADRIHQPYRSGAMPESTALIAELRSHGYPAVLSGAGPTVLAMVSPEQAADVERLAPPTWRSLVLDVDGEGVRRHPGPC